MKRFFFLLIPILTFVISCKNDTAPTVDNESETQLIESRNRVAQLELESSQKDSIINETISFFNDVQLNLAKISIKEEEIRIKSSNPEITKDEQEWILQEIQNINFLRKENAKTIERLQNQISSKDLKINELNQMIDQLVNQIKSKDEQISVLQNSLRDLDMEYATLFDEYQEQVELALDVMKELNTVYYAYGTKKELIDNDIIIKEGGFIGIGRTTNIAEDFNEKYFEKLDKTKIDEITILGKKPKIITDHPYSSYEWQGDKLIILDKDKFWRVSNYLVVEVK